MGYTGGKKKDPTYYDLGDHTEAIQIDFDPRKTTYRDLLAIFWQAHNPCATPFSRQYMSAIFCQNDGQKKLALETKEGAEADRGLNIKTAIEPAGKFYLAEDYHQKFYFRRSALVQPYNDLYPKLKDFVDSTAVTRLNGYLGGSGSQKQLASEIDRLGLSSSGREALKALVSK